MLRNLSLNSTFPNLNIKNEVFAGLTVAMTMIPESLSFAILAGLSPLTGLYAAFLMGIVTAILGGRPGMVSGGAGATVIVLIALAASHGVQYLFAAVVLAGLIQLLVGILKWGKFVRLIPQPVMYGFLNGLAIVIFMSQVVQFKVLSADGQSVWISGSLPSFHIPTIPFTLDTLNIILPYAVVMAAVGLVESLLTLNMVDEITNTKGRSNKEARAQGIANMVNGFFGGMGGCAMVAQTLVNLDAGGRTRLSAIIAAITILVIILVGAPLIEQIPMAALVGVMVVVAVSTFQWVSIRAFNKFPISDMLIGLSVAAVTVIFHNLALAVLIGVILSALVFSWDNAKRIRARKHIDENGVKHYELYGPLFFGSTTAFLEKFDVENDPQEVIIDFRESRVADMSAIDALNKLTERYSRLGKRIVLTHLSPDSRRLLKNAEAVILVNMEEDPVYQVMPD